MKTTAKLMAGAWMLLAVLASCDKNSNYPKEYVGFEKRSIEYAFSPEKNTEEFDVKIIAADKQDRDREVTVEGVTTPGKKPVFSIDTKKVVIPAKKKSAKVRVKIYPERIAKQSTLRLVCTPKDKKAQSTQLMIKLKPKGRR